MEKNAFLSDLERTLDKEVGNGRHILTDFLDLESTVIPTHSKTNQDERENIVGVSSTDGFIFVANIFS